MCDDAPFVTPLKSFHGRDDFTDLTVKCIGKDFELHRVVLCSQSAYFEKICTVDYQKIQDGQKCLIELDDVDSAQFERVVAFLYTGSYVELDDASLRLPVPKEVTRTTPAETASQLSHLSGFLGAIDDEYAESVGFGPEYAVGYTLVNWFWDSHQVGDHDFGQYKKLTMAAVQHAMVVSSEMYILGDRFLMPSLKILALKHFGAAITMAELRTSDYEVASWDGQASWNFELLAGLTDKIYANTVQVDLALKEPLCRWLAPILMQGLLDQKDDDHLEHLQPVLAQYPDLTRGLMRYSAMTTIQQPMRHYSDLKHDNSLPDDPTLDGYCPYCRSDSDHYPKIEEANIPPSEPPLAPELIHQGWGSLRVWQDFRDTLRWTCAECQLQFCPNQKYNHSKPKTLEWMRAERDSIRSERSR